MPLMPIELRDRTVIITGGANGIGQAMVRAFHAQHADVFFCDIDRAAGDDLVRSLKNEVVFTRVDLRREREVNRWIASVKKRARHINVLINNAARDPRQALRKVTAADWDDLFATNLRAAHFTIRAALTAMPPGASIINLSSITFHIPPADMSTYVATKAGMIGLTRALSRELGQHGIRVNTLSPGWVMTARQLKEHVTPAVKRMLNKAQCLPGLIPPEDIAEVALFLASDASRSITGQEILVDRGWSHV